MKRSAFIIFVGLVIVFFAYPALRGWGQLFDKSKGEVIEKLGKGEVNWSSQMVRSLGSGAPAADAPNPAVARLGAIRAAKLDALRNALETIKGVRLDSQTTIENFMTRSDVIRSHVEGYVKGAKMAGEEKYLSDGSIELIMEIPLAGLFTETVMPQVGVSTDTLSLGGSEVYTGLIIDARGLGVVPAMSPKIVDEDGREVYGSAYVSREYATQMGIVGYARDPAQARSNDRVAANPLIIKGLRTTGPKSSDIVVSRGDAQGLREASGNLSFLQKCRVIILLD